MTKIVTKLPVMADLLEKFKIAAINRATAKLTSDFAALCAEFTTRFNANEWIFMSNKDVCYINDIVAIMPNLASQTQTFYCRYGNSSYDTNNLSDRLKFAGFEGDFPTESEVRKCFNDKVNYFRDSNGYIVVDHGTNYTHGITFRKGNEYLYLWTYNDSYKYTIHRHGEWSGNSFCTIPIYRFNGKNSAPGTAVQAILYWLQYDLTPKNFKSKETKATFTALKNIYAKYKDYLKISGDKIVFDEEKIFAAAANGVTFDFLPNVKALLEAKEVEASQEFVDALKTELLTCDKVRADLDPYDANILVDPNRGHWDLFDYGEGEETAGEIILPEGWTARDPADDINHGIVAIDFGTKSTVVVYENDRLQIIPLQVGSGSYSKGVDIRNYENPTVIRFIDIDSFAAAYKARAGRPKTKWNDVTVSHAAFDDLSHSDSAHYYSYLTGLKQWCGSNNRLKLKDGRGVVKDLSPFMTLADDELNPLEYYAYYLGLYINNMLQERRLFLKYIMSFPVSYEKSVREKMRRAFDRGIRKSLPTAMLGNEKAMKGFIVQDGASEPAAYAITALQEYNFDPVGKEEFYYAVFDFGGGTTDFDFGVFRESGLDRYDYSLIHFGENGDRTLGGENLLKLMAFEVFKANQSKLLNPKADDKSVGKIPFTYAADKQDFVGSTVLIKDSQEANQNMHNLAEALRPIWEDPNGDAAKNIFNKGVIKADLFTDKNNGKPLTGFELELKGVDLRKILRDRIEQGIRNFFIAMKEAFVEANSNEELNIKPLAEIDEIAIFLAGNSSKSSLVAEIFDEYLELETLELETSKKFDAYTKVLLHFDESPTKDECGNSWIAIGSPQISADIAKFGKSLKLSEGSRIKFEDFKLSGGADFTIDYWIYFIEDDNAGTIFYSIGNEENGWFYQGCDGDGDGLVGFIDVGDYEAYAHKVFKKGRWHHVALVYENQSGSWKTYIDGELALSYSEKISGTYHILEIGNENNDVSFYIDEFRVSEGIARWTSAFTLPDRPYGDELKITSADKNPKAREIFNLAADKMPKFKIYPALGTEAAHEIQKSRGVKVDPNDVAAPTGKTGVAFGLLKCRDSGNVKITHVTPTANHTPFQFYIGRNKKRRFAPVIDKNTALGEWYPFIDAGNSFDILYSDLPEATSGNMDVRKARRVNVTLDECDAKLTVFVRAVKSNVIEYQVAADIEDLSNPEKLNGAEPIPITLD